MVSIKKTLSAVLTVIFTLALSGCKDEDFDTGSGSYEGPVTLTLDLRFNPLHEGAVTRGVDANLDFELRNITVLFYHEDADEETGAPTRYFSFTNGTGPNGFTTEQEERVSYTEPHTRHATVPPITMETGGSYRIYAVANVADVLPDSKLATMSEKTLRETVIDWPEYSENTAQGQKNPLRYAIPDAMFGYFHAATDADHSKEHKAEAGTEKQDIIHHDVTYNFKKDANRPAPVALNQSKMTIHAWMKRVISRLTVGFDGSQLNRGVEIYVKSVHIKDAVTSCLLGHDNKAVEAGDLLEYDPDDQRLNHFYSTQEGAEGEAITKTDPYYPRNPNADPAAGYVDWYEYVHGNVVSLETKDPGDAYTPVSLYFMENIQGNEAGYSKAYNENYQPGGDYDKDGKPFGTYLEVEAYYRNTRKASQGKIIYRFMLGQNVTDDFNAERNRHYKLVLRFKGDANDVDWHIDYQEEKNPYFRIPYDAVTDGYPTFVDTENDNETWYQNENWEQSWVWYAYDEEHNPIAEICKELIYYDSRGYNTENNYNYPRTYYQVVTVYPVKSDGETDLRNGLVAQVLACDTDVPGQTYKTKEEGAKISMYYRNEKNPNVAASLQFRGECVIADSELTPRIASGGVGSHDNYLYVEYDKDARQLKLIEAPLDDLLDTRPYWVRDYDQNTYPIVKIGASYWFRENLRAKTSPQYLDEPKVFESWHSNSASFTGGDGCVWFEESDPMYKTYGSDNDGTKYGFLYNLAAICGSEDPDPYLISEVVDDEGHPVFHVAFVGEQTCLPQYSNCYSVEDEMNEWQITPEGWHITGGGMSIKDSNDRRLYGEVWYDHQYLMDYVGDNLFRAVTDKDDLVWPHLENEILQRNLSGLSLLAFPADGVSGERRYDVRSQVQSGDLTGVIVPYWTDFFICCDRGTPYRPDEKGYYAYANPPFMVSDQESSKDYGAGALITLEYIYLEKFCMNISKQYLPVRPCRNSFSYAAQTWSEIGGLWSGIEIEIN